MEPLRGNCFFSNIDCEKRYYRIGLTETTKMLVLFLEHPNEGFKRGIFSEPIRTLSAHNSWVDNRRLRQRPWKRELSMRLVTVVFENCSSNLEKFWMLWCWNRKTWSQWTHFRSSWSKSGEFESERALPPSAWIEVDTMDQKKVESETPTVPLCGNTNRMNSLRKKTQIPVLTWLDIDDLRTIRVDSPTN